LPITFGVSIPTEPERPKSCGLSAEKATTSSARSAPTFSIACSAPEGTKNICPGEIVKAECRLGSARIVTSSSPRAQ
jgi:hypothetical protein